MTALPYPTPHRLKLADAIAAGVTDGIVTARVTELVDSGLVEVAVRLTPNGMAWVTRARTASVEKFLDKNDELMRRLAAGPGGLVVHGSDLLTERGPVAVDLPAESTKDGNE